MISKTYRFLVEPDYDQPDFHRLLEDIANNTYAIDLELKKDVGSTVSRTRYNNQLLVVKRYNTRGVWHAIKRAFRISRAENSLRMTNIFNKAGIHTAPSVAIIQECYGPVKLRSWFICEFIDGEMLVKYFGKQNQATPDALIPDWLKTGVAHLFEKLHHHYLSHGDLKASNIVLLHNRLFLIDMDAAHAHKNKALFKRAHNKDRTRFLKNWAQHPRTYQSFEPLVMVSGSTNT